MGKQLSWQRCCLAAAVLLTLALFSLARFYDKFPGDQRALVAFQGFQTDWLDTAARAISSVGRPYVAVSLVLAAALLLVVLRRRSDGLTVALVLVPMLVGDGLKRVIERPRPDHLLAGTESSSLSFPSGHSVYALLFGGVLIYLLEKVVPQPALRRGLQVGLGVLILAMGASRVYLGVHWPSDVIGGYLYGGLALLAVIALRNLLTDRRPPGFRRRILPW